MVAINSEQVNLMLGDCLERMKEIPNGSVDMILTDPPYRVVSGGNKSNKSLSKSLGGNNGKIFKHNDIQFDEWMPVIYKKLKQNAHCYIMTNYKNLFEIQRSATNAGFIGHNLLVWKKQNTTANRWYMKNCEYIAFFRKGSAFKINNAGSQTVHEFNNPCGNKLHPTEKPVMLMEFYIKNSCNQGGIVLDPFMGSGTTGVACVNLNRKFIGIEMDKNYFDIGTNRIKEAIEINKLK